MIKKDMAIVLGVTENMAFALANVLCGLRRYAHNLTFDILVFEMGVSEKDKELLCSLAPCRFIEYSFSSGNIGQVRNLKRFTEATFSRYECFSLLSEYKKVVWMDIDILIKKNIKEFIDTNNSGIAMAYDIDPMWTKRIKYTDLASNFIKPIPGYELNLKAFNPGIFVVNDDIKNYHLITSWCYEKTVEWVEYLGWLDQSVLNLMVQEFALNVHVADVIYNYNPIFRGQINDAVILHPNGSKKFWNYFFTPEWLNNYKEWIQLGGSRYQGLKLSAADRVRLKTPTVFKDICKKYLLINS